MKIWKLILPLFYPLIPQDSIGFYAKSIAFHKLNLDSYLSHRITINNIKIRSWTIGFPVLLFLILLFAEKEFNLGAFIVASIGIPLVIGIFYFVAVIPFFGQYFNKQFEKFRIIGEINAFDKPNFFPKHYDALDFRRISLFGRHIGKYNLNGINLSQKNLEGINLEGTKLERANLSHANLKFTEIAASRLSYSLVSFKDADLSNADFRYSWINYFTDFTNADFTNIKLDGMFLTIFPYKFSENEDINWLEHLKKQNVKGILDLEKIYTTVRLPIIESDIQTFIILRK